MNINQWVKCPYCGTANAVVSAEINTHGYTRYQVVACDGEAGGCERLFVVGYRLILEVTTLKIKGEEQKYDPSAVEAAHDAWVADGEIAAVEYDDRAVGY